MVKGLTISILAGSMFCGVGLTTATTVIDQVITTISPAGVDQDPSRDGIQLRFEWVVHNQDGQNFQTDAITNYIFGANLEDREMYGFTNYSGAPTTSWSFVNGENSYYEWVVNNPIRSNSTRTFTAFIDETNLVETVSVPSWGYSQEGPTTTNQVQVPVLLFPTAISTDGTNIFWYSPTNSLGRNFIIDRKNDLTQTNWNPVVTNTHSDTTTRYEYPLDTTNSNGFFRVRETGDSP